MLTVETEKEHLRQLLKRDRMSLTENERHRAQQAICASVLDFCAGYARSRQSCDDQPLTIGLYAAVRGEVDVSACFAGLSALGWRIVYPRVRALGVMEMFAVDQAHHLVPGAYGILEPPADALPVQKEQLDILLVPGLGFTQDGWRLGYGGGYYDRYLAGALAVCTIGIGFQRQVRAALPVATHDRRLNYLITEEGVVNCWDPTSVSS
ncbi:5-formyltetrahydrofolate cyclo-ligase [Alicyclobacillus suci]|uniref:5-formyltetrahydrofolate cyclo-ligase n=1 Tax=Alicyclobacillus suci TaxID=2816080 RepID=UPI001A8F6140|nr:5-formyltetrahydrofolate cyclo-ligase [Alicyclobacillus suci]